MQDAQPITSSGGSREPPGNILRPLARDHAARDRETRQRHREAHVIVTVTMNAAMDRTLTVPNFQLGQRHRASQGLTLAGGKGINVARALKLLDVPVVATGLAGGAAGTRLVEALQSEEILNDFVRISGESRTSTAVVDPTAGTYTEINEWGPHVSGDELELLVDKLHYLARGADMVVFAGSLPRGVAESFYADAVRDLNRRGVKTVLDSEGQPLRLGVEAEPFLVSPNQREAEGIVGQELNEDEDFLMALDAIAERGARDVLLAAFLAARTNEQGVEDALRAAVAAGTAATLEVGAGRFDAREAQRLRARVEVHELE